jgi:hypothetical protein
MRDKPGNKNEVNFAFAKHLIGNADATVFGVSGSYWFHERSFVFRPFL